MRAVILGSGEVGIHLARQFEAAGMDVVLVDRDPEALAAAEEHVDAMTALGNVTHWQVLRDIKVQNAGLVVAVTESDEVNLVAAGLAAQCGARRTIARADAIGLYRTTDAIETSILGVSFALCASRLLAHELLRIFRARSANYVGDYAAHSVRVCAIVLEDGSSLIGHGADKLPTEVDGHAPAIIRDGVLRPLPEIERMERGDRLLLVGKPASLARAQAHLTDSYRKHRVVLIGGGDVGEQLARQLSSTERRVQIIERDLQRCHALAALVPKADIVHGDGTSISLQRDQQVEGAHAVIACTRSDDANLMASLLARDLGVPNTFAIVHRHGYAGVYAHLGVTGTIGPHDAIGTMVRSLLPRDGVLRREALPDCSHEIVEYQLERISEPVNLDRLALPPGCLVLAATDQHSFVPLKPGLRVGPRDHLIVAQPFHARKEMLRRLEKLAEASR